MASSGFTLTRIVDELSKIGVNTTIQNLSNKINRNSLKFYEVEQILNVMGQSIASNFLNYNDIMNLCMHYLSQEELSSLAYILNNPNVPYESKLRLRNYIAHTNENPRQVALQFINNHMLYIG